MIENEDQLHYSIQALGRMYSMRDREAAETLWERGTRNDVVEGTDNMIRKVEREVAEYLAKKYGLVAKEREKVA